MAEDYSTYYKELLDLFKTTEKNEIPEKNNMWEDLSNQGNEIITNLNDTSNNLDFSLKANKELLEKSYKLIKVNSQILNANNNNNELLIKSVNRLIEIHNQNQQNLIEVRNAQNEDLKKLIKESIEENLTITIENKLNEVKNSINRRLNNINSYN